MFAETLGNAATRGGRELAQATTVPKNPHKTAAIALVGGGAALLVIGLLQDRGVEVGTNANGTTFTAEEKGGSKTALMLLGGGAMAAGAGLFAWGESKKRSIAPGVHISPTRAAAGISLRF